MITIQKCHSVRKIKQNVKKESGIAEVGKMDNAGVAELGDERKDMDSHE